jgi:uncharacterized protein (TIGR00159 family)
MADILDLLASVHFRDVIDIGLLTAIIYWLLLLIKGTRTIPILLGLSVLIAAYGLATFLGLEAITWVMEHLFGAAVVILVVLFQTDIRNALARLGISTMFRELSASAQSGLIDEVVVAATALSRKKVGATIVMERETGLRNYIDRGKKVDAEPTVDLLVSIFQTTSPLHDGAVIIDRQGRLAAARCILPLSATPASSASMGTRHRSALGLSEETDAVTVVVSEETGRMSIAFRGALQRNLKEDGLRGGITQLLKGDHDEDATSQALPQAQTT